MNEGPTWFDRSFRPLEPAPPTNPPAGGADPSGPTEAPPNPPSSGAEGDAGPLDIPIRQLDTIANSCDRLAGSLRKLAAADLTLSVHDLAELADVIETIGDYARFDWNQTPEFQPPILRGLK